MILSPTAPAVENPVRQLERLLNSESAATLRELMDVLSAPPDAPRLRVVLRAACLALAHYRTALSAPSPLFHLVQTSLEKLSSDVAAIYGHVNETCDLEQPLLCCYALKIPQIF